MEYWMAQPNQHTENQNQGQGQHQGSQGGQSQGGQGQAQNQGKENNPANFANDREKASEGGRKGGQS
jgi:uncharacterized protein